MMHALLHLPEPNWRKLPRWRGFNLLNRYSIGWSNEPFKEEVFQLIRDWGFDFVRLPLDYRTWTFPEGGRDERVLGDIDRAVGWGRAMDIHICLNLHRAPGYCINPPHEPESLWVSSKALERCCREWAFFAARYRGLPNRDLSFNLLNEPKDVSDGDYIRVCAALAEAIRNEDPDRLILCDGNDCGTRPLEGLIPLRVAQGTRGYWPFHLTHYRAPWVPGSLEFEKPEWPAPGRFDPESHWLECVKPWKDLEEKGVGVMVGEWGVYNKTPHDVTLRFMEAMLSNWEKAGWGWAVWNLTGDFGPLDSQRADVTYEDYEGHALDRAMLDLLQKH